MNEKDIRRRRYTGILEAGLSAIISKGSVLVVNLVSVPIVVRYLGSVQFGVWATISTSLSLLLVLDLGIANTLTNLISEAYAKENNALASTYASTAFWLMIAIVALLAGAGWIAWPFLNWSYIFHIDGSAQHETSQAVVIAFGIFLLGMPASLGAKLLGGYQELQIANVFSAAGNILSLIGVIVVVQLRGGLAMLVGVSSGSLIMANWICLLWIWLRHKPWLTPWPSRLNYKVGLRLLNTGIDFFILQIAGLVVFNSDNLIIAHFAGPSEVTPYNITWRLASYAAVFQTVMIPALWPAYAEAYVRKDMKWIREAYWRLMKLTTAAAGLFCFFFIVLGKIIIHYWAGDAAVPSQSLIIAMSCWIMINTIMNNEACLLIATQEIRLQVWLGVCAAIVNLVSTIWLMQRIGILGVILGTIFSYIIVVIGPQTWKVTQLLGFQAIEEDV